MTKATVLYDCSHSIREDNVYGVIMSYADTDVQEIVNQAKQQAIREYGDYWCLDDVIEIILNNGYDIEFYNNIEFADV